VRRDSRSFAMRGRVVGEGIFARRNTPHPGVFDADPPAIASGSWREEERRPPPAPSRRLPDFESVEIIFGLGGSTV